MTVFEALLPRTANNDYRGGRVPLYFFYALRMGGLGMTGFTAYFGLLELGQQMDGRRKAEDAGTRARRNRELP